MSKTDLYRTLESIGKHDRLPTAAVLQAIEDIAKMRRDIEEMHKDLARIEATPFGKRQAD